MLADLAGAAYLRGEYAEMRSWAQQIEPTVADDGAVRAAYMTLLAVGAAYAGEVDAAAAAIVEALAAVEAATDDELAAAAELVDGGVLGAARARTPARRARGAPAGSPAPRAPAGNGLASILHDLAAVLALGLLGRMTEAEAAADEVEQAARVSANAQLIQWALWMRAWVLMESGRLDAALAAAQESVELAAGLDDSASPIVARAVLGAVLGARGEHARARDLLAAYDIDRGWICRWAPHLVESDLALGDLARRPRARRARGGARARDRDGGRARGGRPRARRSWRWPTATRRVPPRSRSPRPTRRRPPAPRSRRRATGSSPAGRCSRPTATPAIAQLTAAGEQAARCGAPRVADEARLALRRAGVRVGRGGAARARAPRASPALSPREREIAELVAEGLTNREIGARLFLSEKTIETHLTRVFQKLGLRSRAQVAAAVARPG